MKLIHISDLHIGKRVNEFSMLDDQADILNKITDVISCEKPDCIIIAGDVYDKSIPSAEAVQLLDKFLSDISGCDIPVFIISGNHDSPERIAFGANLMKKSGIYMSPVYDGNVLPVTVKDGHGEVNVYMLPFIRPANVRRFYPDDEIESYTDAVRTAIDKMNIDYSARNILITHQFVTGAIRSDSEDISVGGTDNVDVAVFDGFDYVALGHIHRPQNVCSERVRYCGTPLMYSFSEVNDRKSVTIAEFSEKGTLNVRETELVPKHQMREISGKYNDIVLQSQSDDESRRDDYIHVILTDEEDIYDAVGKLRIIYPNIMKLDYNNQRTKSGYIIESDSKSDKKTPIELFEEFYIKQNNQPMSDVQKELACSIISEIWEGET